MLDRLLHRSVVLTITGESDRMRAHRHRGGAGDPHGRKVVQGRAVIIHLLERRRADRTGPLRPRHALGYEPRRAQ